MFVDVIEVGLAGINLAQPNVSRCMCGIAVADQSTGLIKGQGSDGKSGNVKDASLASHTVPVEFKETLVVLIDVKDQKEGKETTWK